MYKIGDKVRLLDRPTLSENHKKYIGMVFTIYYVFGESEKYKNIKYLIKGDGVYAMGVEEEEVGEPTKLHKAME